MVHDVPGDPDASSTYECLKCGELVTSDSHPGDCEGCGGAFQDRALSLE